MKGAFGMSGQVGGLGEAKGARSAKCAESRKSKDSTSLFAHVFIVTYADYDDSRVMSVWSTMEAARAEESRLERGNTEAGSYSIWEYEVNAKQGWVE